MVARSCRRVGWAFALVVAALALLAGGAASAGAESHSDIRITIELRGLSLGEALEIVADMSGQQLEVRGNLGERKVSVMLRDATLQRSLEKILYPQGFVVDWSARGRATVHLLGGTGVASTSFGRPRALDGTVGRDKLRAVPHGRHTQHQVRVVGEDRAAVCRAAAGHRPVV